MEILNDFNTSVAKALEEIDPDFMDLEGVVICGTHSPKAKQAEEWIERIQDIRELGIPFLGICFGHQLAGIEYARNVLGMYDATSEEWGPKKGNFIVKKLPKMRVGLHEGESYWHNYELDPFIETQWNKNWNFITAQFHPEYQSSIDRPHPLLVKFLTSCGSTASHHLLDRLKEKHKTFGEQ